MNVAFLDTVGLLAIWHDLDQWHNSATEVYQQLIADNYVLMTTPHVLYECGNAAARGKFRNNVDDLRLSLSKQGLLLVPSEVDEHQAWANYRQGHAANAGIVDQISFVIMRRFGLTEAFTNDAHFRAAGFTTLIPTAP